jgi:hypothetical protein
MHQIKIFKNLEFELEALEQSVNQWLAENPVKVINIFGNISPQSPKPTGESMINRTAHSPSDIMIVVVYEKP